MTIISEDGYRYVDIGTSDILFSVYSTIHKMLEDRKDELSHALAFLKSGECHPSYALTTARELNKARDYLAAVPPQSAVYNELQTEIDPPWKDKISPVVTSCANLFTTADGKDLFFELVSILYYSHLNNNSVVIAG